MRTDTTFDDHKRPPSRQHYVNGVLPQSLIITLGGKNGLKIFQFCLSGALFRTFFGHPYPPPPRRAPPADGTAEQKSPLTFRSRACDHFCPYTDQLGWLLSAGNATSINSEQGIATYVRRSLTAPRVYARARGIRSIAAVIGWLELLGTIGEPAHDGRFSKLLNLLLNFLPDV